MKNETRHVHTVPYPRRVWGVPIAKTKKGEDIYRSASGEYAVERDHLYLAAITDEEKRDLEETVEKAGEPCIAEN